MTEVSSASLAPASACPNCGHPLREHDPELGCVSGWAYDHFDRLASEGCDCPLAAAGQHLGLLGVGKRADGWRGRM